MPREDGHRGVDGMAHADAAQIEPHAGLPKLDRAIAGIEPKARRPDGRPCRGELAWIGKPARASRLPPERRERPDGRIECPAACVTKPDRPFEHLPQVVPDGCRR